MKLLLALVHCALVYAQFAATPTPFDATDTYIASTGTSLVVFSSASSTSTSSDESQSFSSVYTSTSHLAGSLSASTTETEPATTSNTWVQTTESASSVPSSSETLQSHNTANSTPQPVLNTVTTMPTEPPSAGNSVHVRTVEQTYYTTVPCSTSTGVTQHSAAGVSARALTTQPVSFASDSSSANTRSSTTSTSSTTPATSASFVTSPSFISQISTPHCAPSVIFQTDKITQTQLSTVIATQVQIVTVML